MSRRSTPTLVIATALGCIGSACGPVENLPPLRASLLVEPSEVTLANVPVLEDTEITLFIPNQRAQNLESIVVALREDSDPAFSLVNAIDRVAPGETGELTITVRPVEVGTVAATAIIDCDREASPNHIEIPISITAGDGDAATP